MRQEFTRKTKEQAFKRANGHCEGCGSTLVGQSIRYDHRITDWMGGANTLENCSVLGRKCCDVKKTGKDQGNIAKVKRIRDKRSGALKSRRPFRGWRSFRGEVIFADNRRR